MTMKISKISQEFKKSNKTQIRNNNRAQTKNKKKISQDKLKELEKCSSNETNKNLRN